MTSHFWHFIIGTCMTVFIFQFMLSVFVQQDISRSTEERARCEEAARKYALDALDHYLDPDLKIEGVSLVKATESEISTYIQQRLTDFDNNKSDVQNLRVTAIKGFEVGSYSQITALNDELGVDGEKRVVQSSYPSFTFEVQGEMLRIITKQGDAQKTFPFKAVIKVVLGNISRDNSYTGTTNIKNQPYNNMGSWG